MVGVAGRSRGCKTCRRRRVKCDEHHPTCKRCEKAGYTCEGYQDRNFIIFDNTIKHENAIQSYKSSKASESTSSSSSNGDSASRTTESTASPQSTSTEIVLYPDDGSFPPGFYAWASRHNKPLLWSPVLDRMGTFMGYTWTYLYRGAAGRSKIFEIPGADIKASKSLAYLSVEALATSFFGFRNGNQDVMIDGQTLYGTALSRLNGALSHRNPKNDCDVLAAIVMLCLFEFLMPASITGWMFHALGLGGMFKLLGPELCSQYPYHTYFETCRLLIVYAQLALRLDTFLANKEWLTIPWLTRSEGKTAMEEIIDVLTQVCRVQKYWDDVIKQRDQPKRDRLLIRYDTHLKHTLTELQNWSTLHKAYCEYQRTLKSYLAMGSILVKESNAAKESSRPALIQTTYEYPDLDTANMTCMYHGILILLTIFVHNPPSPTFTTLYPEPSPPPPKDSPMHNTFLTSGLEIAKSTDFHLLEYQDSAGSFHLIFPIRMCCRAFEEIRMKEEEKWANGVLRSIAMGSNRQWAFAGKIVRENGKDVHEFRRRDG